MTLTGKPQIPAGDTFYLVFDVVGQDEQPATLEGATIRWALARMPTDANPLLQKTLGQGVATVAEVVGRFVVTLTHSDTERSPGDYYHQATVTFADSTVATVARAYLSILATI